LENVAFSWTVGEGYVEFTGPWEWTWNPNLYCARDEGVLSNADLRQSAAHWNATILPILPGVE